MNAIQRRRLLSECEAHETDLNGFGVMLDPAGVLVVPDERLLVVSDLHLEKGAAFARRGMMLPPYDTAATLELLARSIERHRPARVVCLGDSFHDRHGAVLMPEAERRTLTGLMAGRDWIWIAGNHDPEPPLHLGGEAAKELAVRALVLRHDPSPFRRAGEVAGHLHPVARVAGGGLSVRGACFASDGWRMILPSFGVTTGGLNVLDAAFAGLFETRSARAYVIGSTRIYPIGFAALSRG